MSITSSGNWSRTDLETHLEFLGATMQSAVSSRTDLVIALENPSSAKIAKAEKLGIPIVYLEDYLANR